MVNKYHSTVMNKLYNIRNEEETALKRRRDEIFRKIPRIKEIENDIGARSLSVARNAISSGDLRVLEKLKEEIKALREEKYYLLEMAGYPADYLTLKYHCKKCEDTGLVNGKRCSCYNNMLINAYYEDTEFATQLKKYNFANFDISLFDDTSGLNGTDMTVRSLMIAYLKYLKDYIENFGKASDNILITGGTGTGKTFISTCIANELIKKGHSVVYRTVDSLISELSSIKFGEDTDSISEDMLLKCDLLIIDDLGTENITDYTRTLFFNFLNKKLLLNNKMIINTNFSLSDLQEKYSERTSSRLIGEFKMMNIPGIDLRLRNPRSILE